MSWNRKKSLSWAILWKVFFLQAKPFYFEALAQLLPAGFLPSCFLPQQGQGQNGNAER
jgi:hypothetical protein